MERRTKAAVYYENGKPLGYTLFGEGQQATTPKLRGIDPVITTFAEAYRMFGVLRSNYTPDGMPLEA